MTIRPDSIRNVHLRRLSLVLGLIIWLPLALVYVGIHAAVTSARWVPADTRTIWSRDYRGHW